MLNIIFLQSLILLCWFNTDAFIEYFKYIPSDKFKIKAYLTAKSSDVTLTYHMYLLLNHYNFFVKLITCPICLNTWLSIMSSAFGISFIYIPVVCILSLLIYYLLVKLM
jgi:hypothetical protein